MKGCAITLIKPAYLVDPGNNPIITMQELINIFIFLLSGISYRYGDDGFST